MSHERNHLLSDPLLTSEERAAQDGEKAIEMEQIRLTESKAQESKAKASSDPRMQIKSDMELGIRHYVAYRSQKDSLPSTLWDLWTSAVKFSQTKGVALKAIAPDDFKEIQEIGKSIMKSNHRGLKLIVAAHITRNEAMLNFFNLKLKGQKEKIHLDPGEFSWTPEGKKTIAEANRMLDSMYTLENQPKQNRGARG